MKNIVPALTAVLALHAPAAMALASCSSDGVPRPVALFERFISADCEACWSDAATPAPSASASALVVDWIVPGRLGDDAPLSAAASRDGLNRLQGLGRPAPTRTDVHTAAVQAAPGARLRVAMGLAFNDYIGTGIAFTAPGSAARTSGAWQYHLLLVETVPAGTSGTPVIRNVVRNALQGAWNPTSGKPARLMENRPMRIPEGAQPDRLRVLGWVQDGAGQIVAAAQSLCR